MRDPKKRAARVAALLWAGSICLLAQAGSPPQKLRNHFDADAPLGQPAFFDFLVLGVPGGAEWKVTLGRNSPSAPNHVTQVIAGRPADSIAVAARRNAVFRDGALSLAIERGSGRGGLALRLASEKDFCTLLVDLVTGEARLIAYRSGRPTELAQGRAALDNQWGFLSIIADGPSIVAKWDGQPLLKATDLHPSAGRAGMATAGPGRVSFDEFVLEPGEK